MAASYKARCIVLKKTKLGEADLILTMLAQDGTQVKGVAKGARKPGNKRFGARLEPFSVVDLQLYPGRSLETITEARCITSNASCREDLDRSSACSVIAELVAKVIADGEVDERVFPMMQAAFAQIGEGEPGRAAVIAIAFAIKAIAMMGLRPALHECALCGDTVDDVQCFDVEHGGVVCPSCLPAGSGDVDVALVPWVDLLLGSTFAQLAQVEDTPLLPMLNFVDRWVTEHLGIRLKTTSFMRMSLMEG